jgi:hypothetical protein
MGVRGGVGWGRFGSEGFMIAWHWPQFFMVGWIATDIIIQLIRATRLTGPSFRLEILVRDAVFTAVIYFGGFWS